MTTILRTLSYQYPWLYNGISAIAALSVGTEPRMRRLALENLNIDASTFVLDLCCGSGQTTRLLTHYSKHVTGLDISPVALSRAKMMVPEATYVEGLAQQMPLPDSYFDLVHTSVALHEMNYEELQQIFKEVYRVLKPGGIFTFIDLHTPTNWLFWPPLSIFIWLFETPNAWGLLRTYLPQELLKAGLVVTLHKLYAGGSLQIVQARKSST